MIETIYRFAKHGTTNFPVQVRSTGFYRVWDGWRDLVLRKYFVELFWGISGTGEFTLYDGRKFLLKANQCCCYFPGDCHRVQAVDHFEFCWVTFDGKKCSQLIEDFSLSRTPWDAGECPQELFAKLRSEIRKPGIEGEIKSGAIGYELLSRAKTGDYQKDTMLAEHFIAAVENCYSDPDITIDAIAARLGVHRSTLIRNVYAVCKESPQKYLTEFRLQKALTLLNDSTLSIKEISEKTGYSSSNYFGKVFLRTFGKTPSEMRELQLKSMNFDN